MDDQTRYAFCVEMANIAKSRDDLDGMNEWYSRAWYYLQKNSDDGVKLEGFKVIKDCRNV
jgi:transcription initiation factor IIE alpha subunit